MNHRSRRNENQRGTFYDSDRARVNSFSSVWGLLDACRRYGRRNPAGDTGALREQGLSNDVRVSVEAGFRKQPEQNTNRTLMGSPPASAIDARRSIPHASGRDPATPRGGKPCEPAI